MNDVRAASQPVVPMPALVARGSLGGVLMGLANLVPGISGGTMLLAAGVYPQFIDGIAEVTTLRFRPRSLTLLAVVAGSAATSILLFAGFVKDLVLDHRWIMYSLFIGLTLGGVPILKRMIGRPDKEVYGGAAAGFLVMTLVAVLQAAGVAGGANNTGVVLMFVAGILGASAMILPGVSGGYLLLVMGVYVPILSAIDSVKDALRALDLAALVTPLTTIVIPVGVGVIIGIAGVSNVLKWMLAKYQRATLGVLVGLLLGAVIGLYPFQRPVEPALGSVVKGQVVTEETLPAIAPEDWPQEAYVPTPAQVAGAVGLVTVGFFVTLGVSWVGRDK